MVVEAKKYIDAGDIIQVVPSQRFSRGTVAHPFSIYRALRTINPDASTRPMHPDLVDEGFEPFEIPRLWMPSFDADVDTYVDISETIDVKIQALRCHKSQIGDWPVDDWIRDRARQRGEQAGLPLAESFRTFLLREPREDDTQT